MALTYQMPKAAAEESGGGGGSGPGNNTTGGAVVYPYVVSGSLFPSPANLSSSAGVAAVTAVPDPSSPSTYAVVNASTLSNRSDPAATVWFDDLSYSGFDATEIGENGTCGANCGDLPLNWSNQSEVASFSAAITSLKLSVLNGNFVVGISAGASTYLYTWSAMGHDWQLFTSGLSGTLLSLATSPEEVAAITTDGAAVILTSFSADGSVLGRVSLSPSGTNSTGVLSASVVLIPVGSTYSEVVVLSAAGSNEIQESASSNPMAFPTPAPITNFTAAPVVATGIAPGTTPLSGMGGLAGQLAMVSVGSEVTLLFTTYVDGSVAPAALSSGDDGSSWEGPYLFGEANGSVADPVLSVGPANLVYAAWNLPTYGPGAVGEVVLAPDGLPMASPSSVSYPSFGSAQNLSPPALAVDGFERPILLWPARPFNETGGIAYTGAFLPANTTLGLLGSLLDQSVGSWDFSNPSISATALASFLSNVSEELAEVNASASAGDLCAAQELTGGTLYQSLTHVPLLGVLRSGSCPDSPMQGGGPSPLLGDSGLDVPDTYLAVYLDWVLEAEGLTVGTTPLAALSTVSPYSSMAFSNTLSPAVPRNETVDDETVLVSTQPTPYSPTVYELVATDQLPTWSHTTSVRTRCSNGATEVVSTTDTTTVSATWANVSIDGGASHSFSGSTSFPSVWVYDLPADGEYGWSATYGATTSEVQKVVDGCDSETTTTSVSPVAYGPAELPAMTVGGTFNTSLTLVPGLPFVVAQYNGNRSSANLSVEFNATLPATVSGNLTNSSGSQYWNTSAFAVDQAYTLPKSSGVGEDYTLVLRGTSRSGSSESPGSPSFAYTSSGSAPPEAASAICSFSLASEVPTVSINNSGDPYTSINATTVNVTWNSTVDLPGFFTYNEVGTPLDWTITGISPVESSSGAWVYTLELHGLEPMATYNGTMGVSVNRGCLVTEDQLVEGASAEIDPGFYTDAKLPYVWEKDLLYNSVDRDGGGVLVGWVTPANPAGLTLKGGYVRLADATHHYVVPFTPSEVMSGVTDPKNSSSSTNEVNLTNLTWDDGASVGDLELDHAYSLEVVANYTYLNQTKHGEVTETESATNSSSFVYQRDSSKDGLTDAEKTYGWSAIADDSPEWVNASPADYATNGLVRDYVEDEFALNPRTLSTSDSNMLDTWNLTFDLGPASASKLPTWATIPLVYYYENSTYDPVQSCSGPWANSACFSRPTDWNWTNLTCVGEGVKCANARWMGDSSVNATDVMWSEKDLAELGTLIQQEGDGWLRATTGSYDDQRTITIWGKLSWGANPWETSTSGDGLTDGSQPDPLGPVVLQLNLSFWNETLFATGQQQLGAGSEAAPLINVTVNGSSAPIYSAWGADAQGAPPFCYYGAECLFSWYTDYYDSGPGGWVVNDLASIPITTSSQYATVHFELMAAISSGGALVPTASGTLTVNLEDIGAPMASQIQIEGYSLSFAARGAVSLNYTVLSPAGKANTLLITPPNEATLSTNPLGSPRYVGEPDFDLLELNLTNASKPLTLGDLPDTSGSGSYSVSFQPGLNNILVPRGTFIYSPLGQALLNDTDESLESSGGLQFSPWAWSENAFVPDGWPLNGTNVVRIFAPSNESAGNLSYGADFPAAFGGVPGDPSVEQGVEARSIQSVIWINITNTSGLGNESAELLDLLAGLVLNTSGNVSYQATDVSGGLPWLTLPPTVLAVLGSHSLPNSGSFGPPVYESWVSDSGGNFFEEVWNAISGVASYVVQIVEESATWLSSAATAAEEYVAGAIAGAITSASLGLSKLANQTIASLKTVQSGMFWAAEQTVNGILAALSESFSLQVSAIKTAESRYVDGIMTSLGAVFQNLSASTPTFDGLVDSVAAFLLSLMGASSLVTGLSSIFSGMGQITSRLPGLLNPIQLVETIARAIGGSAGDSFANSVQQTLEGLTSLVLSAIGDAVSGFFDTTGLGSQNATAPSSGPPIPSSSQVSADVSTLASGSGQSGASTQFGSALSVGSGLLTFIDIVHICLIIIIIGMLVINGYLLATVPSQLLNFGSEFASGFSVESAPQGLAGALGGEVAGLALALLSILVGLSNWVYAFAVALLGAVLATGGLFHAGVSGLLTGPQSIPFVVSTIVAWFPPIVIGLEHS